MLRTAGIEARWIEGDTSLNGVLNNDHFEVEQFGQFVSSNQITFMAASADVENLSVGHHLLIEDVTYVVGDKKPHTSGTTTLDLRETS